MEFKFIGIGIKEYQNSYQQSVVKYKDTSKENHFHLKKRRVVLNRYVGISGMGYLLNSHEWRQFVEIQIMKSSWWILKCDFLTVFEDLFKKIYK